MEVHKPEWHCLEDILMISHGDELMDQLLMTEWDANNAPVSSDLHCSGYVCEY